jgi:hypothetical protein
MRHAVDINVVSRSIPNQISTVHFQDENWRRHMSCSQQMRILQFVVTCATYAVYNLPFVLMFIHKGQIDLHVI